MEKCFGIKYFDDIINLYDADFCGMPFAEDDTLAVKFGGVRYLKNHLTGLERDMYHSGISELRFYNVTHYVIGYWNDEFPASAPSYSERYDIGGKDGAADDIPVISIEPACVYYPRDKALFREMLHSASAKRCDEIARELKYISLDIYGAESFSVNFDETRLADYEKCYNSADIGKYIFFNNIGE